MQSKATNSWQMTLAVRALILGADRYRQTVAERYGLSVPDIITLGDLYQSGPMTPRSIATRLAWTTGGVTALLDRLERAGYVARVPNPDDRRSVLIQPTPRGRQAMEQSFGLLQAAADDAHRAVGLDPAQIIGFLTHAAEALATQPAHDAPPGTQKRRRTRRPAKQPREG